MTDTKPVLEVQQDGRIFIIPDCPVGRNFHQDFAEEKRYKERLASAERILCADQDVALDLLWRNDERINSPVPFLFWKENMLKPGIYPIPDLKWKTEMHNPCLAKQECQQPGENGWKCLHECKLRHLVAVIIQEDEKNGMYEETKILSAEEILNAKGLLWVSGYQRQRVLEAMDYYARQSNQTEEILEKILRMLKDPACETSTIIHYVKHELGAA